MSEFLPACLWVELCLGVKCTVVVVGSSVKFPRSARSQLGRVLVVVWRGVGSRSGTACRLGGGRGRDLEIWIAYVCCVRDRFLGCDFGIFFRSFEVWPFFCARLQNDDGE